jgi:THO complex subunit 5
VVDHCAELRGAAGGGPADEKRLAAAANAGLLLLMTLREELKGRAMGVEAAREETAATKAALDAASQTLHNLIYERQHLQREVAATREFTSAVTDEELDLPSPAALAEAAAAAGGPPPPAERHALAQAQLRHELAARKALAATLTERRQAMLDDVSALAARRNKLEGVARLAGAVAAAARPLQELLVPPPPAPPV